MQCPICGKTFEAIPSNLEVGRDKYCSRECYKKGYALYWTTHNPTPRNRITKPCENCGKEMQVTPSLLKRKRFCSKACKYAWQRSITGEDHPLHKSEVVKSCEWCGTTYTCKPSLAIRSRFCSRQCQGASTAYNFPQKQTAIEAATENILKELCIPYIAQKPMGPFICDFVISDHRLAIECDGAYWHSSKEQRAKDDRKDSWLRSHGYTILRLKEHDIHSRPNWCRIQIAKHLIP